MTIMCLQLNIIVRAMPKGSQNLIFQRTSNSKYAKDIFITQRQLIVVLLSCSRSTCYEYIAKVI